MSAVQFNIIIKKSNKYYLSFPKSDNQLNISLYNSYRLQCSSNILAQLYEIPFLMN